MTCGCLFDMIDDILFDMNPFEMIVISKSGFDMTFALKSKKSKERLSIRNDAGLSFRYDGAKFLNAAATSGACDLVRR